MWKLIVIYLPALATLLAPPNCIAQGIFNLILLPDPFSCHQVGLEIAVSDNNRLGLLGVAACKSNRPTFGSPHPDIDNSFSRLLLPWTYTRNSAWTDSFFIKPIIGRESHRFRSKKDSNAEVVFMDYTVQAGYQWFWKNGFNITTSGGLAYLARSRLKKTITSDEDQSVIRFLDDNTETNVHAGIGVILGWLF